MAHDNGSFPRPDLQAAPLIGPAQAPAREAPKPPDQAEQFAAKATRGGDGLPAQAAQAMAAGDFERAAAMYQRLAQERPRDAAVRRAWARALGRAGRMDQAGRAMKAAVDLEPANPSLLHELALVYMDLGRWHLALVFLERALAASPGDLEETCQKALAKCREVIARPQAAMKPMEQAPAPDADKAEADPKPTPEPIPEPSQEAPAISLAPAAKEPGQAKTPRAEDTPTRPPRLEVAGRKRRVLFVQTSPCIRNFKECRALTRRGHQVALAYSHKPLSQMYDLPDSTYAASHKFATPQDLWELSREFEVVHCHNEPDFWTVAALAGDKPVVHDTHDMISLRQPGEANILFLESVANRGADGRVYVSDYLLQAAAQRYGVDQEASLVMPNFVGTDMLPQGGPHTGQGKLSQADGKLHLVYEGGITERPGTHRSLLPFLTDLARQGWQVHIHPSFHNPAVEQVARSTPGMHYQPPCPPTELLPLLTRYDFGLIPFQLNGTNRGHLDSALPNKLFEYLAAGLPVIAANLKSLRDFILSHEVGFLYDNLADIQNGLKRWRPHDLEADNFTMEAAAPGLEALYAKAIRAFPARKKGYPGQAAQGEALEMALAQAG